MHDRPTSISAAIRCYRTRWGREVEGAARPLALVAALLVLVGRASAQETLPLPMNSTPAMGATDPGAPPMSQSGDVSFFSQDLGTILRLRYNTESYGQDHTGNFDIGTMQVVTMDDTAVFLDGQVTMNESDGVGFNVGLGYRWMNYFSSDKGMMQGISLWADGMHTDAGSFFPQVGVSFESLGEMWELRANGYIPFGQREQVGAFEPTGETGFVGNSIASVTEATVDRSFYAADLEFARRLGPQRDAWGFVGPYFVANDTDDSAGIRVGARGYAYPDLLVQFAVSNDDVFKTNAAFSVVWFVGRTRTNFQPTCTPADNFRAPVIRNDYVVLSHTKRRGGAALTNPDGSALRVVHVDSDASPSGDGTFEHPFDMLSDINGAGSNIGDIILAHSTSVFTNDSSAVLKDNQRLLGEGNNLTYTVATKQKGTITLPESSKGARALAQPKINIPANTDAIILADSNEVANFNIDGHNNLGTRAIVAPPAGAGNPNLHDLSIKNTTGDAIHLTPFSFIDVNDLDNDGNTTERIVHGNVTINKVTLDNVGGNGIDITGTSVDVTQPNVQLQETIALSSITSTNGAGRGIAVRNTHSGAGHTTTLTNYTYDGGATSAGGIQLNNFDGAFSASASTLTGGLAATSKGVEIIGDTDGTITFQNTVAFSNIGGTVFDINGDAGTKINGAITVAGAITKTNNATGHSVSVQNLGAGGAATFNGNVTDKAQGVLLQSNTGGSINFNGNLSLDTGANNAFDATGGGTISAPGTNNTARTSTGQTVKIRDMSVGTDVRFSTINRTAAAASSAIELVNNTGGGIELGTVGNDAPTNGTIVGGAANPVTITNSANATVSGIRINTAAGFSAVRVEASNANTSTINLNNLDTHGGAIGVETVGGGTGAFNMSVNDSKINFTSGDAVVMTNVGTIDLENVQIVSAGGRGVAVIQTNAAVSGMDVTINELNMNAAGGHGIQATADSGQTFALRITNSVLQDNVKIDDTGAGHFGLLVENDQITTGGIDSFALTFGGAAASGDVTIQNNQNFMAGNARALFIDTTGAPTVRLLVRNSTFINSSLQSAAVILGENTSTSDVTIKGNTFQNNGAGDPFSIRSENTANINLQLGGTLAADRNTATGTTNNYILTADAGTDFEVFDQVPTFGNLRNNGNVTTTGTFTDLPSPPQLPSLP